MTEQVECREEGKSPSVYSFLKRWLLPSSLPGRFFLFMLLLVFATQLVIRLVWEQQNRMTQETALADVVSNMAMRVSSTIEYFDSLPISIGTSFWTNCGIWVVRAIS